jgi:hypothetical protein
VYKSSQQRLEQTLFNGSRDLGMSQDFGFGLLLPLCDGVLGTVAAGSGTTATGRTDRPLQ